MTVSALWPILPLQLFYGINNSMHQYSVDIFSYSGSLGILGSDGKQNAT